MMDLGKLKFWEKKEEGNLSNLPDIPSYPTGVEPGTPPPDHGTRPPSPQPYYQAPVKPIERVQEPQGKDHEIINLKLDAIKNSLESINMRLEKVENILLQKSPQEQKRVWYK